MPLTVDEVGTAPGLARSGSPAATTRPAGPLRAAGKTLVPKPGGWRGRRQGIRWSHSSPRQRKGGVGVGRGSPGELFGDI